MSLIPPDKDYILLAILLASALFGVYGERKGWFKNISGVLVTIFLTAILVTVGIIPSASDPEVNVPVYGFIFKYFVPVSIPLLLFQVHIKKIINESGRLLVLFLIGAVGVALGAILASVLINVGDETYKLAGVLTGTYTGGSVNFMATAASLDFLDSPLFPSTIAVDNVFTNFYIMLLFLIPSISWITRIFSGSKVTSFAEKEKINPKRSEVFEIESWLIVFLISISICGISFWITPFMQEILQTNIPLEILLITILITLLVNVFPNFFSKYAAVASNMGMFLLYIFLATIGAASDLRSLFSAAPGILLFALLILGFHFLWTLTWGKILKFTIDEICLASCANAGGPSVVAPMAISFQRQDAVTPSILVAILGYVVGTFLGISVGLWLQ